MRFVASLFQRELLLSRDDIYHSYLDLKILQVYIHHDSVYLASITKLFTLPQGKEETQTAIQKVKV